MSELENGNENENWRAVGVGAPADVFEGNHSGEASSNPIDNVTSHSKRVPLILDRIPLHAPKDVDKKGRQIGKAPLKEGWRRAAPMTEAEVQAHLAEGMNVGARLRDDQLVIDVDPRSFVDKDDPLKRLIADVNLPDAPTVETGGGGRHIYLRKPANISIRDALDDYPGIEFKTLGRQVVLPPSVHPNGQSYKWDVLFDKDMLVPDAPDTLIAKLRKPSRPSAAPDGAMTSEQLSKLLEGLDARDFGSNDLWLPIAMSCHHATGGEGIDAFLDWCATDPDYRDRSGEVRARWDSFHANGDRSVSRLTLYKALHHAGRGDLVEAAERSTPEDDFPDDVGDVQLAAPSPKEADLIERMNERFCAVLDGGKFAVFKEDTDETYTPPRRFWTKMSRADFIHYHEDERIKIPGNKREINVAAFWLQSYRRRKYSGIVLDPEKREGDKLNLWRGWAVDPIPGKWSLMRSLIEDVLCSGERSSADYVLRWIAFMVQKPGISPETAIIFRGKEGTGKGTLGRALMDIAGIHGLTVSSPSQFAGRFNAHLRSVAFLFADEAFWPGDKEAEGVLKQLVTEPVISFEGKGAEIVSGRNLVHLMMASNNEWVVPAGVEARRFAVFDVSDGRQNDKAFFEALNAQMKSGGLQAMLHDMLHMDLNGWHPSRSVPKTQALADQKVLSLDPASKWWMEQLGRRALPVTALLPWESGPVDLDPAAKAELVDDFDRFLKANRVFSAKASHRALATAGRPLGLETGRTGGGKERTWTLPPLDEARRRFQEWLGAGNLFC
jgi:hypothetical protein